MTDLINAYVIYLKNINEIWGNLIFYSRDELDIYISEHMPKDINYEIKNMQSVFREFRNKCLIYEHQKQKSV